MKNFKKTLIKKKWKSVFKMEGRQPYECYMQNLNCEVYKPHQMDFKEA